MQNYLSKEWNVDVDIRDISFGPNEIIISNIKIDNPEQTMTSHAAQINKITIHAQPWNLLRNKVHIERLEISHPEIGIEYYNEDGTSNNWTTLLSGLAQNRKKRIIIDLLMIYEIEFEAFDRNSQKISIWPIPFIEIKSIGDNKGLSLNEITHLVFQTIVSKMITRQVQTPVEGSDKKPLQKKAA